MITDGDLYLHQAQIGPMDNFVYILADLNTRQCAVVDPAWDVDYFITHIRAQEYELESIFLTHGHGDHVNGIDDILKFKQVPIYLSSLCFYRPASHVTIKHTNMSPKTTSTTPSNTKNTPYPTLSLGNLNLTVIPTPGHSPGGQCFLFNKTLIAGDTIFIDGCGNCHSPGANVTSLYNSIQTIKTLGDDIIIYPGHDYGPTPTDTIGNQKKTNPYFTDDLSTVTKLRLS